MKLSLFVKACFVGLVAGSCGREPEGHEWHPPVAGDGRSPCPGLNAMANHGWIPRSGKNIDLTVVRSGVAGAYNFEPTTFDSAFQLAVDFNLTTTGNISTFNLVDLAKHDAIEFDGSLSRNDFYFGDDLNYDPVIWATMAVRLGLDVTGPSEMDKYVTVETAEMARRARVEDAMRVNPTFNASANQMMGSPGATALYLATLMDEKTGAAPKAWIKAFFQKERIPYLEGYHGMPDSTQKAAPKTNVTIADIFARVMAVES